MMQTWPLPGRQLFYFIFPEGDSAAISLGRHTPFPELSILISRAPHGPVILTGRALIFIAAKLVSYNAGLHPYTRAV
jgi:hypothetical protein